MHLQVIGDWAATWLSRWGTGKVQDAFHPQSLQLASCNQKDTTIRLVSPGRCSPSPSPNVTERTRNGRRDKAQRPLSSWRIAHLNDGKPGLAPRNVQHVAGCSEPGTLQLEVTQCGTGRPERCPVERTAPPVPEKVNSNKGDERVSELTIAKAPRSSSGLPRRAHRSMSIPRNCRSVRSATPGTPIHFFSNSVYECMARRNHRTIEVGKKNSGSLRAGKRARDERVISVCHESASKPRPVPSLTSSKSRCNPLSPRRLHELTV